MRRLVGERVGLRRDSVHPPKSFDGDQTTVGCLGKTEAMAGERISEGGRSRQTLGRKLR